MNIEIIDLRDLPASAPAAAPAAAPAPARRQAPAPATAPTGVARVNGVALHDESETPAPEVLRQRACTELLRQAAIRDRVLDAADPAPVDGTISEAASQAIETWLETALQVPDPSDDACRRWHAAHPARYRSGEQVRARHILFAVTPGTDVVALRGRAERCLLDVRSHDGAARAVGEDGFARAARELSNCPSGEQGGDLDWLTPQDCAPEFARELFGRVEVGVLPRLVHSRFGLHVVEVLERRGGVPQAFDAVRESVSTSLRRQAWITALRQCLRVLAGQAVVEVVALDAADTPLVQ
jgi:peptidyl-prolyl cis-trans isomerase C